MVWMNSSPSMSLMCHDKAFSVELFQRGFSQQTGTMRYAISLPQFQQKCAQMSALNQCNSLAPNLLPGMPQLCEARCSCECFLGFKSPSECRDVKVFNPSAPSYHNSQSQAYYVQYGRMEREHMSSVTMKLSMVCSPLWFSVYQGEWGRLPLYSTRDWLLIGKQDNQPYSLCIQWLRCQLNFSLICSSIICLRGNQYMSFPSTLECLLLTITDGRIRPSLCMFNMLYLTSLSDVTVVTSIQECPWFKMAAPI